MPWNTEPLSLLHYFTYLNIATDPRSWSWSWSCGRGPGSVEEGAKGMACVDWKYKLSWRERWWAARQSQNSGRSTSIVMPLGTMIGKLVASGRRERRKGTHRGGCKTKIIKELKPVRSSSARPCGWTWGRGVCVCVDVACPASCGYE